MEKYPDLKELTWQTLLRDMFVGVILAAVSIPISMGYAQIAGLPAVYGLYGSVFPILIFGLLTSSRMFIFGVDAAPCVLVGSGIASFGIAAESPEALRLIPLVTIFVALWLLLFWWLKSGRAIKLISNPVMGGFISGICASIILMQLPKLMGGEASHGELPELLGALAEEIPKTNLPSLLLGGVSLAVLLVLKRLTPKIPAAVLVMAAGALLMYATDLEAQNVRTLTAVQAGLPAFVLPDFRIIGELASVDFAAVLKLSLAIALVIMAETLLAESNYAHAQGYKLRESREILTFAACNAGAALSGCCPVNGSISRTALGAQYGATSRVAALTAGGVMILLLLFGTGFIVYLPVPVLAAIIISALISAMELELAWKLWRTSKREFAIFWGAFFGVLLFGTVDGVLIGMILSFASVLIATMTPLRDYRGVIPGRHQFYSLARNGEARPIQGVLLYKYTGNLHFATVSTFVGDIEAGLREGTTVVIVDGAGINHIDASAAEKIEKLYLKLKKAGIKLYFTEHIAHLNDAFRRLGLDFLFEEGAVRRNIVNALEDAGIKRPYPLEEGEDLDEPLITSSPVEGLWMEEYEWAFGLEEPTGNKQKAKRS